MTQADVEYWDQYFRELRESGDDLDWGQRWIEPFRAPLQRVRARTVLELGCGTGNDAARLAQEGYSVTAVDLSGVAIALAQERYGGFATFAVADIASPLPFPASSFDAVMSNVALHRFSDGVTRAIFSEVARVVSGDGLFLFHVNAVEDRELRAKWRPVAKDFGNDVVLEESGQTMHFFSEPYLRELLCDWADVRLELLEIEDRETGEPFKRVWRGVAFR